MQNVIQKLSRATNNMINGIRMICMIFLFKAKSWFYYQAYLVYQVFWLLGLEDLNHFFNTQI